MGRPLKIAVCTVGCRANQADSAELLRGLDRARFAAVGAPAGADVVVVNTCCVTAEAERDCRKLVRRSAREAPGAAIVVTGCAVAAIPGFAERLGGEAAGRVRVAADAQAVLAGLEELARARRAGGDEPCPGDDPERGDRDHSQRRDALHPRPGARTRALLKVQTGCSHGCAYCIVPRARGEERSTPIAEALAAAARLADEGYRELVLTGVQLGAWGRDLGTEAGLAGLVAALADRFAPGRVRLSSIEPWSVDAALLEVVGGHPGVCRHLHVPLQSGADRVLGLMRRGYLLRDFAAIAEAARARVPGLGLGTDVLCGFPTESEDEHALTLRALEELGFTYVHAFPYSPRPGTRAAALGGAPGRAAARRRVRAARAVGARLARRFLDSQIGAERQAIVESSRGGVARGLTDNFLAVEIPGAAVRVGELVRVRIEDRGRGAAVGAVVISRESA
jgi:threonylcarbamoyladenosine tRNA methylthiotransferase MtaB